MSRATGQHGQNDKINRRVGLGGGGCQPFCLSHPTPMTHNTKESFNSSMPARVRSFSEQHNFHQRLLLVSDALCPSDCVEGDTNDCSLDISTCTEDSFEPSPAVTPSPVTPALLTFPSRHLPRLSNSHLLRSPLLPTSLRLKR